MKISVANKLEDLGVDIDLLSETTVEAFRQSVAGVAKAAQAEWIRLAQHRLGSSREIYIGGLRQAESFAARIVGTTTVFEITLVGRMPNNFEFGQDGYDMKSVRPGWLGGGKAKTGKDGKKYIVIPFRHSITSGARLAYSGKARRADLKKELKKTVKEFGLNRLLRTATGQVARGPVKRVPRTPSVHRYLHGLTKVQDVARGTTRTGKQRGSSQLFTWRVMSENSPPESWHHPGLKAVNLLAEVEKWVDTEFDSVIQNILRAAGARR
jgi:hypothetical protein